MTTDISLARGDGARRMTYAEAANQGSDGAERRVEELSVALAEVRTAEIAASERAKAAMDEAADLRWRLDVAEKRIEGERTRAEQERGLRAGERERAQEAERQLAGQEAAIAGLTAEKQEVRRQNEAPMELLKAKREAVQRSWWRRAFGR